MKNMLKNNGMLITLIALSIVVIVLSSFGVFNNELHADAEKSDGFTHEPIQFEDFTFELIGSTSEGDRYTFHYELVNTSNSSINASKTFFKIMNGDKLFSSDDVSKVENRKLNPGMSTLGEVTFVMKPEDLNAGTPIMEVKYGYLFDEVHEFELVSGE